MENILSILTKDEKEFIKHHGISHQIFTTDEVKSLRCIMRKLKSGIVVSLLPILVRTVTA